MATNSKEERSLWSFQILRVSGIPIKVHLTFLLFLVWILFALGENALKTVGFILALFLCVALHELGHALAARHYGIETSSITLYPIGGLAIIEKRPKPAAEIWIALAGPLVNIVIAFFLALGQTAKTGKLPGLEIQGAGVSFIQAMFAANLVLALFNLIPAFPMDGGRVLRALVSLRVEEPRATSIAVGIGQSLAVFLFFGGMLEQNWILVLVAALVFIAASQELAVTTAQSLMEGKAASDAMITEVVIVGSGETIEDVAKHLIHGSQHDFPVKLGDDILGVITHAQIVQALALDLGSDYVAGHMSRDFASCKPTDDLELISEQIQTGSQLPIIVIDADGRFQGMVTKESVSEYVMLAHARSRQRSKKTPSLMP